MKLWNNLKKYIKSRSRSMLLRMYLSSIAVSLLVISILGIYTYNFISRNLEKKVEMFEQKKINETLNKMDLLFDEMLKLTLCYENNQNFTQFFFLPPEKFNTKLTDTQNNIKILSSIVSSVKYIKSMFIYYANNGYILGNFGLVSNGYYYDKEWKEVYEHMTGKSQIMEIRRIKNSPKLYDDAITLITGIPYNNGKKLGAIILNLDPEMISDILKSIINDSNNEYAFIINEKGVILSSSEEDYLNKNISELTAIPSGTFSSGSGKFIYTIKNTKMVAFFDTSNINNWKLVHIIPENILYNELNTSKSITLFIILLIISFTIVISLYFSLMVYSPIKSIINNIKAMVKLGEGSDISLIQSGLSLLSENNRNLEEQVNQNKIKVKEMFLSNLITGKLFNKSEIKSKAEYLEVDLENGSFKVAVIQNNSIFSEYSSIEENEIKIVAVINLAKKIFNDFQINILTTQDTNDNILLLIKIPYAGDAYKIDGIITQVLEDIKLNIEKYISLDISIGIGRTYYDLTDIGVSYKEALEALQYKFLKEDLMVISIEEINDKGKYSLHYPIDKEQKLISLVKSCDYDKVIICLNSMIGEIITHNKTFGNIEVCLKNIIGIIQRCIFELKLNDEDVFKEKYMVDISVDRFKNIQQFTEWVSEKLRKIIDYKIGQEKGGEKSYISDVKEYIRNNYSEKISLQMIAEHFNYNPSYFSRIFKEKTGTSFWDYVAEVRIENAKKLLIETKKSIDEISSLLGYNHKYSFIRTFKKHTATTPGEFRLKYKSNNSLNR